MIWQIQKIGGEGMYGKKNISQIRGRLSRMCSSPQIWRGRINKIEVRWGSYYEYAVAPRGSDVLQQI